MKTISLVIPVHNLEKFIEPMLISLKYQEYDHDHIEPIFICDCCADKTHELIEHYLKDHFSRLVILDRNYHSSGLSRNDGLELASGDVIWLLDGDDWLIDNHAIIKVMRYFEEKPDANVLHVGWISNTYGLPEYLFTVWQWVWSAKWAKAVKFTSQPYDDDVVWVKSMIATHNIYAYPKMNQPFYFYNYMREGSVMFTKKQKKTSD